MTITTTRSERAKLDFVGGLMAYNSMGIGKSMFAHYEANKSKHGQGEPSFDEVKDFMEDADAYKFGAFFERHNHAMMFQTTLDIVARQKQQADAWLNSYNEPGSVGSLTLDPDLAPPKYYNNLEIHTQPGNYHGEYGGVLYDWMIHPFLVHRDDDNQMGWDLANGVPKRNYQRILDLGCGVGKSTLPYCDLYPDAEIHGIDYAAPMLKYAHKKAETMGKSVHYAQQLAEDLQFEDESFDLVTALWLYHEIPRKSMDKIAQEAYRVLRPGGVFAIMESPPFSVLREKCSPLSEFLLDSTGRRMEDPYIPMFFSLDRVEMVKGAAPFDKVYDKELPNHLTGWSTDGQYFFGAFPWWVTIGEKN